MTRRPDAHLIGLVVLVALWGLIGQLLIASKSAAQLEEIGRIRIYSTAIGGLWLLFAYVAAGLRGRGLSVRTILDPLPFTARRVGIYGLMAAGMSFTWGLCSAVLGLVPAAGQGSDTKPACLLPARTSGDDTVGGDVALGCTLRRVRVPGLSANKNPSPQRQHRRRGGRASTRVQRSPRRPAMEDHGDGRVSRNPFRNSPHGAVPSCLGC